MVGERERERAQNTVGERQEKRERGREKAGRVFGRALEESNIRPFSILYVGI